MSFKRNASPRWHEDVPGARWFKADLHVHTIDDQPGGRAKMPTGLKGDPENPEVCREYARVFLSGVIRAGVQALGLTPHATKVGNDPDTSAVWQIIDVWNTEEDSDGVLFRDKIYAVFPGFEPSFKEGREGLHLLFLFDPEIGRDRFLRAFALMMGGVSPYQGEQLQVSNFTASEAFKRLDEFMNRESPRESSGSRPWDVLVLAPHVDSPKGLFGAHKAQILQLFEHSHLAGLELPDNKLPEDLIKSKRDWLQKGMERYRHAFFHSSDAYGIAAGDEPGEHDVGYRTTWVKLASPRIEALRQAFLASESRMRIAYERDQGGVLHPLSDPPDPLRGTRPWLRRVTVRGGAAFFGGRQGNKPREVTVNLSPDLTCVIGGSMTGKSTLLDGLRVYVGAELPTAERLRADVEARGREGFLAGGPDVELDTPGRRAGSPHERWPAIFFTQNELQRLAQDPGAVEDILARLVPDEQRAILDRSKRLAELDAALASKARQIGELLDQRAEAEQQLSMAREAKDALKAFEEAGLAALQATERLHGETLRAVKGSADAHEQMAALRTVIEEAGIDPEVEAKIVACLERIKAPPPPDGLGHLHTQAIEDTDRAMKTVQAWAVELRRVRDVLQRAVEVERQTVARKLAEKGHGAEKLAEFQTLSRKAGMLSSYTAAFNDIDSKLKAAQKTFERDMRERERLVGEQRATFDRVKERVERQFNGRIRVKRIDHGVSDDLERFIVGFNQRGITRWWNGLEPGRRPSPECIYEALENDKLGNLGVSATVAERFKEVFSEAKRFELRSLRSPDQYTLELRVDHDEYRRADQLSGGKRVSLLLTLLLEGHDDRPLVIDQPEDELDNRFLWETVLPALRRLKGQRQVIVATHNANIVVNGDADLVVQLEADAEHGRVAVSGAIEDPSVRRAVIETLDGGEKAFELRKAKYGF